MANKRHKPEEIVTKLRQVDVLVGQGMARIDATIQFRIVEQSRSRLCFPTRDRVTRGLRQDSQKPR